MTAESVASQSVASQSGASDSVVRDSVARGPVAPECPTADDAEGDCCEPAWLDDLEIDAWRRLAAVLTVLPSELDAQMQRRADLNQFEYHVLSYLSEAPGHTLRISDLATLVRGSLSRISHLIKRLERRGWLRREPVPEDGRYTNAILTDAGYEKVVAAAPIQLDIVRQLVLAQLSRGQLKQLRDITNKLLAGVDSFKCVE